MSVEEPCYYPLLHMDIELTRTCNNSCIHCSSSIMQRGLELTTSEIKELLTSAKNLGLTKVGFTGGEPLLQKDKLSHLLEFTHNELHIPIHVHTNGRLLDNGTATLLKKYNTEVTISIFGSSGETHDLITKVEGSFDETMKGLKTLLKVDSNVSVYFVPMKPNLKEIHNFVEMISKEGCNSIRILSLSPTGRALEKYRELQLDDDDMIEFNLALEKLIIRSDVNIVAGFCTRISYPKLTILKGHDECYSARNRVHVDSFGSVFPCTAASGRPILSAGNIRDYNGSIKEIWTLSPYFQFLRNFTSNPPKKCSSCVRYDNCMSGCRVMVYYEHGDISIADPDCGGPFIRVRIN